MLALAILCFLLPAQTPQFEVASVKPALHVGSNRGMTGGPGTSSPGQIDYTGESLRDLVFIAYRVQFYQLDTPQWMNEEYFDIVAKVPAGATQADARAMLQNLLAERFKLAIHHETKIMQGYTLTVGKNGPKLHPSVDGPDPGMPRRFDVDKEGFLILPPGHANMITFPSQNGISRLTAGHQSAASLANYLGRQLQQPVVDQTGLTGSYDFHMAYVSERHAAEPSDSLQASEPAPTLLQAVELYLGLKLESKRVPVDLIVIDRIEKTPTEN